MSWITRLEGRTPQAILASQSSALHRNIPGQYSMTTKPALLLIDHGSRRQDANDLLPQVARMVREMSGFKIVYFAHMELAEPTIQQGFDACVAAGADEVIVHPYFLGPGRHSISDIPRMVAQAAATHAGVS